MTRSVLPFRGPQSPPAAHKKDGPGAPALGAAGPLPRLVFESAPVRAGPRSEASRPAPLGATTRYLIVIFIGFFRPRT